MSFEKPLLARDSWLYGFAMWAAYVGASILFLMGWLWRPLAFAAAAVFAALGLIQMSED
jgi:hypothetical protein